MGRDSITPLPAAVAFFKVVSSATSKSRSRRLEVTVVHRRCCRGHKPCVSVTHHILHRAFVGVNCMLS